MISSTLGFSLVVSVIIVLIMYFIDKDKYKDKTEKQHLNDKIIMFIVIFSVVCITKACINHESIIGDSKPIVQAIKSRSMSFLK